MPGNIHPDCSRSVGADETEKYRQRLNRKPLFLFEITQLAYNPFVPTPFYHLGLAQQLLEQRAFSREIHDILERQRSAFLFGNTAADVQVISGQKREATHFFNLPLKSNRGLPWERMLVSHPLLRDWRRITEAQAAFIAGYLCHLLADWLWIGEIFVPAFGLQATWGVFTQRLYLHNVLRAYLDRQSYPELHSGTSDQLKTIAPFQWLPFVQDQFLFAWRDYLATQLQPGAKVQTIEVLAQRQGVSPQEYVALLGSEERMENEIFIHLPHQELTRYRQRLECESIALVNAYFLESEKVGNSRWHFNDSL
jgi:hypothetical protein